MVLQTNLRFELNSAGVPFSSANWMTLSIPKEFVLTNGELYCEGKVLSLLYNSQNQEFQPLQFLPPSEQKQPVYFQAVEVCAAGGKKNVFIETVFKDTERGTGITEKNDLGVGELYVQTASGTWGESPVFESIKGC